MKRLRAVLGHSLIFSALFALGAGIFSCDSWMSGDDFFEEIEEEVKYANAQEVPITVEPAKATQQATLSPSGTVTEKIGIPFSVSFAPSTDYGFYKWAAFPASIRTDGTSYTEILYEDDASYQKWQAKELSASKVAFTSPYSDSTSSASTTVTANTGSVWIVPVVAPRPELKDYLSRPNPKDTSRQVRNQNVTLGFAKDMDLSSFVKSGATDSDWYDEDKLKIQLLINGTTYRDGKDYFMRPTQDGSDLRKIRIRTQKGNPPIANSTVVMTLGTAIKDKYGFEMAAKYEYNYTVGTTNDTDAPVVSVLMGGLDQNISNWFDLSMGGYGSEDGWTPSVGASLSASTNISDWADKSSPAANGGTIYMNPFNRVKDYVNIWAYVQDRVNGEPQTTEDTDIDHLTVRARPLVGYDGMPGTGTIFANDTSVVVSGADGTTYSDYTSLTYNTSNSVSPAYSPKLANASWPSFGMAFTYVLPKDIPDGLIRLEVSAEDTNDNDGVSSDVSEDGQDYYSALYVVKDTTPPSVTNGNLAKITSSASDGSAPYGWYNASSIKKITLTDNGLVDEGHEKLRSSSAKLKWYFKPTSDTSWEVSSSDSGWASTSAPYSLTNASLPADDGAIPLTVRLMDDMGNISSVGTMQSVNYDGTVPRAEAPSWVTEKGSSTAANDFTATRTVTVPVLKIPFVEETAGLRRIAVEIGVKNNAGGSAVKSDRPLPSGAKVWYEPSGGSVRELSRSTSDSANTDSVFVIHTASESSAITTGTLYLSGIVLTENTAAKVADGTYAVKVTLYDSALNAAGTVEADIALDTTPPQVEKVTIGEGEASVLQEVTRSGDTAPAYWLPAECYSGTSGAANVSVTVSYSEIAAGVKYISLSGINTKSGNTDKVSSATGTGVSIKPGAVSIESVITSGSAITSATALAEGTDFTVYPDGDTSLGIPRNTIVLTDQYAPKLKGKGYFTIKGVTFGNTGADSPNTLSVLLRDFGDIWQEDEYTAINGTSGANAGKVYADVSAPAVTASSITLTPYTSSGSYTNNAVIKLAFTAADAATGSGIRTVALDNAVAGSDSEHPFSVSVDGGSTKLTAGSGYTVSTDTAKKRTTITLAQPVAAASTSFVIEGVQLSVESGAEEPDATTGMTVPVTVTDVSGWSDSQTGTSSINYDGWAPVAGSVSWSSARSDGLLISGSNTLARQTLKVPFTEKRSGVETIRVTLQRALFAAPSAFSDAAVDLDSVAIVYSDGSADTALTKGTHYTVSGDTITLLAATGKPLTTYRTGTFSITGITAGTTDGLYKATVTLTDDAENSDAATSVGTTGSVVLVDTAAPMLGKAEIGSGALVKSVAHGESGAFATTYWLSKDTFGSTLPDKIPLTLTVTEDGSGIQALTFSGDIVPASGSAVTSDGENAALTATVAADASGTVVMTFPAPGSSAALPGSLTTMPRKKDGSAFTITISNMKVKAAQSGGYTFTVAAADFAANASAALEGIAYDDSTTVGTGSTPIGAERDKPVFASVLLADADDGAEAGYTDDPVVRLEVTASNTAAQNELGGSGIRSITLSGATCTDATKISVSGGPSVLASAVLSSADYTLSGDGSTVTFTDVYKGAFDFMFTNVSLTGATTDATYTVAVSATDNAGWEGDAASYSIVLDRTKPVVGTLDWMAPGSGDSSDKPSDTPASDTVGGGHVVSDKWLKLPFTEAPAVSGGKGGHAKKITITVEPEDTSAPAVESPFGDSSLAIYYGANASSAAEVDVAGAEISGTTITLPGEYAGGVFYIRGLTIASTEQGVQRIKARITDCATNVSDEMADDAALIIKSDGTAPKVLGVSIYESGANALLSDLSGSLPPASGTDVNKWLPSGYCTGNASSITPDKVPVAIEIEEKGSGVQKIAFSGDVALQESTTVAIMQGGVLTPLASSAYTVGTAQNCITINDSSVPVVYSRSSVTVVVQNVRLLNVNAANSVTVALTDFAGWSNTNADGSDATNSGTVSGIYVDSTRPVLASAAVADRGGSPDGVTGSDAANNTVAESGYTNEEYVTLTVTTGTAEAAGTGSGIQKITLASGATFTTATIAGTANLSAVSVDGAALEASKYTLAAGAITFTTKTYTGEHTFTITNVRLTGGEGSNTVRVSATDRAGWEAASGTDSNAITLDMTKPTLTEPTVASGAGDNTYRQFWPRSGSSGGGVELAGDAGSHYYYTSHQPVDGGAYSITLGYTAADETALHSAPATGFVQRSTDAASWAAANAEPASTSVQALGDFTAASSATYYLRAVDKAGNVSAVQKVVVVGTSAVSAPSAPASAFTATDPEGGYQLAHGYVSVTGSAGTTASTIVRGLSSYAGKTIGTDVPTLTVASSAYSSIIAATAARAPLAYYRLGTAPAPTGQASSGKAAALGASSATEYTATYRYAYAAEYDGTDATASANAPAADEAVGKWHPVGATATDISFAIPHKQDDGSTDISGSTLYLWLMDACGNVSSVAVPAGISIGGGVTSLATWTLDGAAPTCSGFAAPDAAGTFVTDAGTRYYTASGTAHPTFVPADDHFTALYAAWTTRQSYTSAEDLDSDVASWQQITLAAAPAAVPALPQDAAAAAKGGQHCYLWIKDGVGNYARYESTEIDGYTWCYDNTAPKVTLRGDGTAPDSFIPSGEGAVLSSLVPDNGGKRAYYDGSTAWVFAAGEAALGDAAGNNTSKASRTTRGSGEALLRSFFDVTIDELNGITGYVYNNSAADVGLADAEWVPGTTVDLTAATAAMNATEAKPVYLHVRDIVGNQQAFRLGNVKWRLDAAAPALAATSSTLMVENTYYIQGAAGGSGLSMRIPGSIYADAANAKYHDDISVVIPEDWFTEAGSAVAGYAIAAGGSSQSVVEEAAAFGTDTVTDINGTAYTSFRVTVGSGVYTSVAAGAEGRFSLYVYDRVGNCATVPVSYVLKTSAPSYSVKVTAPGGYLYDETNGEVYTERTSGSMASADYSSPSAPLVFYTKEAAFGITFDMGDANTDLFKATLDVAPFAGGSYDTEGSALAKDISSTLGTSALTLDGTVAVNTGTCYRITVTDTSSNTSYMYFRVLQDAVAPALTMQTVSSADGTLYPADAQEWGTVASISNAVRYYINNTGKTATMKLKVSAQGEAKLYTVTKQGYSSSDVETVEGAAIEAAMDSTFSFAIASGENNTAGTSKITATSRTGVETAYTVVLVEDVAGPTVASVSLTATTGAINEYNDGGSRVNYYNAAKVTVTNSQDGGSGIPSDSGYCIDTSVYSGSKTYGWSAASVLTLPDTADSTVYLLVRDNVGNVSSVPLVNKGPVTNYNAKNVNYTPTFTTGVTYTDMRGASVTVGANAWRRDAVAPAAISGIANAADSPTVYVARGTSGADVFYSVSQEFVAVPTPRTTDTADGQPIYGYLVNSSDVSATVPGDTVAFDPLSAGSYSVCAVDYAGNVSSPYTVTVKEDVTPPAVAWVKTSRNLYSGSTLYGANTTASGEPGAGEDVRGLASTVSQTPADAGKSTFTSTSTSYSSPVYIKDAADLEAVTLSYMVSDAASGLSAETEESGTTATVAAGESALSFTATDRVGNSITYTVTFTEDPGPSALAMSGEDGYIYKDAAHGKTYYRTHETPASNARGTLTAAVPVTAYSWTSSTGLGAYDGAAYLPTTSDGATYDTLYYQDALGKTGSVRLADTAYGTNTVWVYDSSAPSVASVALAASTEGKTIGTHGGTYYYYDGTAVITSTDPGTDSGSGSGIRRYAVSTAEPSEAAWSAAASVALPDGITGASELFVYVQDNVGNISQTPLKHDEGGTAVTYNGSDANTVSANRWQRDTVAPDIAGMSIKESPQPGDSGTLDSGASLEYAYVEVDGTTVYYGARADTSAAYTFTPSGSEDAASGVAGYVIDASPDGNNSVTASPAETVSFTGLADAGTHTIRAVDLVGNVSEEYTVTTTLSGDQPTLGAVFARHAYTGSEPYYTSGTAAESTGSGTTVYTYTFWTRTDSALSDELPLGDTDGPGFSAASGIRGYSSSSGTYTPITAIGSLSVGTQSVYLWDNVGNTTEIAVDWKTDAAAPTLAWSANPKASGSAKIYPASSTLASGGTVAYYIGSTSETLVASVTVADGDATSGIASVTYARDGGAETDIPLAGNAGSITFANSGADGTAATYVLTVTDNVGLSSRYTVSLTPDVTAPVPTFRATHKTLRAGAPAAVAAGGELSFTPGTATAEAAYTKLDDGSGSDAAAPSLRISAIAESGSGGAAVTAVLDSDASTEIASGSAGAGYTIALPSGEDATITLSDNVGNTATYKVNLTADIEGPAATFAAAANTYIGDNLTSAGDAITLSSTLTTGYVASGTGAALTIAAISDATGTWDTAASTVRSASLTSTIDNTGTLTLASNEDTTITLCDLLGNTSTYLVNLTQDAEGPTATFAPVETVYMQGGDIARYTQYTSSSPVALSAGAYTGWIQSGGAAAPSITLRSVEDNSGIKSVTAGGSEVAPAGGVYTVSIADGTTTPVVLTDYLGNTTAYSFALAYDGGVAAPSVTPNAQLAVGTDVYAANAPGAISLGSLSGFIASDAPKLTLDFTVEPAGGVASVEKDGTPVSGEGGKYAVALTSGTPSTIIVADHVGNTATYSVTLTADTAAPAIIGVVVPAHEWSDADGSRYYFADGGALGGDASSGYTQTLYGQSASHAGAIALTPAATAGLASDAGSGLRGYSSYADSFDGITAVTFSAVGSGGAQTVYLHDYVGNSTPVTITLEADDAVPALAISGVTPAAGTTVYPSDAAAMPEWESDAATFWTSSAAAADTAAIALEVAHAGATGIREVAQGDSALSASGGTYTTTIAPGGSATVTVTSNVGLSATYTLRLEADVTAPAITALASNASIYDSNAGQSYLLSGSSATVPFAAALGASGKPAYVDSASPLFSLAVADDGGSGIRSVSATGGSATKNDNGSWNVQYSGLGDAVAESAITVTDNVGHETTFSMYLAADVAAPDVSALEGSTPVPASGGYYTAYYTGTGDSPTIYYKGEATADITFSGVQDAAFAGFSMTNDWDGTSPLSNTLTGVPLSAPSIPVYAYDQLLHVTPVTVACVEDTEPPAGENSAIAVTSTAQNKIVFTVTGITEAAGISSVVLEGTDDTSASATITSSGISFEGGTVTVTASTDADVGAELTITSCTMTDMLGNSGTIAFTNADDAGSPSIAITVGAVSASRIARLSGGLPGGTTAAALPFIASASGARTRSRFFATPIAVDERPAVAAPAPAAAADGDAAGRAASGGQAAAAERRAGSSARASAPARAASGSRAAASSAPALPPAQDGAGTGATAGAKAVRPAAGASRAGDGAPGGTPPAAERPAERAPALDAPASPAPQEAAPAPHAGPDEPFAAGRVMGVLALAALCAAAVRLFRRRKQ